MSPALSRERAEGPPPLPGRAPGEGALGGRKAQAWRAPRSAYCRASPGVQVERRGRRSLPPPGCLACGSRGSDLTAARGPRGAAPGSAGALLWGAGGSSRRPRRLGVG